tara:strand:+ start:142 stop:789 length:648 start_codon:yes stop_codon:yes gene_type:complete
LSYLLNISSVSKTFNRKKILSDISFSLEYGSIIGLEGSNGVGKSTLFKIISGVMKPNSGEGYLINLPIFKSDYTYRKFLIYWSHDPQFYSSLTGYENLKLFLNLRSESSKIDLIYNYAKKYDLNSHLNQELREYSFGQIQKLKLIQLSISDWDLALLDEPDSGMDKKGKILLENLIQESKQKNKTIFVASHNQKWLKKIIDKKYCLKNTRLIKND